MFNFGEKLKDEIEYSGLTPETFAKSIGVPKRAVYEWCRNVAQPNLTNIIKIADYFNCSIDYLVNKERKYDIITIEPLPKFSESLKKYMSERSVKQKDLAIAIGVNRTQIFRWTSGLSEPQLENLMKIADYFKIPIDVLIGRQKL